MTNKKAPKTPLFELPPEGGDAGLDQSSALASGAGGEHNPAPAVAGHTPAVADPVAALAAGATLESAAALAQQEGNPAGLGDNQAEPQGGEPESKPSADLLAYFKEQAMELSKVNQQQAIDLEIIKRDLKQATDKANEHAELLSGLTVAAQAAITLRNIQMGKASTNLTHMSPQDTLALFNTVHNQYLSTFASGRHSSTEAEPPESANVVPGPIPDGDTVRRAVHLRT